jgi:hypothetical protein
VILKRLSSGKPAEYTWCLVRTVLGILNSTLRLRSALKEIKGNLGSESKKFLSVRLTGDPELKKVFDSE